LDFKNDRPDQKTMKPMLDLLRNTQIQTILLEVFDSKHQDDYDANFWWYFRQCRHNGLAQSQKLSVERLIQEVSGNFQLARFDPKDRVILDAGCGYGIATLIMSLMGAREAHGIDLARSMIETFQKILASLPDNQEIYPKIGDINHSGYPDSYFDFVLSNEAISHYYNLTGFIEEVHRIIKPGGMLFISDANNGANPFIAWRSKKLWDRFENGPVGEVFYSTVDEPYVNKRSRIIRETCGNITDKEVLALAKSTFGFTREQTIQASIKYTRTGESPDSYYRPGVAPIDPDNDNFQERLIHPVELTRQLARAGFTPRIYAYLGGAGGNHAIRWLNTWVELTSPVSWPLGRALKVVAIKT
jgi:2-polyprenyl-3-methyl-5-hydroxy-6-metoxy-1,4-benzoquinol methylase